MINVGTVRAYLTLSTAKFHEGIGQALTELDRLEKRTRLTSTVFGLLKGALSSVLIPFSPLITAFGNTGSASERMATRLSTSVSNAGNTAGSAISGLTIKIGSIASALSSAQGPTAAASRNIASGIAKPLGTVRSSAYNSMLEVGNGLISGLTQKQSAVIAKARSIANSVAYTIRSALGIASPSKVTRELGFNTGLGFELGLADSLGGIEERANMLAAGAGFSIDLPGVNVTARTAAQPAQTFSSRTEQQLDRLIRAVENADKVLQLDGRTFARLVHEYY